MSVTVHYRCPRCSELLHADAETSGRFYLWLNVNGSAHASTCPKRVRFASWIDRPDPIQKLIPAAAKMREPITVKAVRARR